MVREKKSSARKAGSARKLVAVALAFVAILGVLYAFRLQEQMAPREPQPVPPVEQRRATSPNFAHIHGLAIDPTDSTTLYVATHHGLFRIKDGSSLSFIGTNAFDLMGFSLHPKDPKVMYASGHPPTGGNLGFIRSTDGGVTWRKLALSGQVDFHAMTVVPPNPDIIYGWDIMSMRLYKTTDGGNNWKTIDAKGLSGVIQLVADTKDSDRLYAATDEGLYVSFDGGSTWTPSQQLKGSVVVSVSVDPKDNGIIYAVAYKKGLYKTSDAGRTWTLMHTELNPQNPQHISIDPSNPQIIFLASSKEVYRSIDGGARFQMLSLEWTG